MTSYRCRTSLLSPPQQPYHVQDGGTGEGPAGRMSAVKEVDLEAHVIHRIIRQARDVDPPLLGAVHHSLREGNEELGALPASASTTHQPAIARE